MKLEEFDYYLPSGFIAQKPIKPRDRSRLMVLNRSRNEIQHKIFKDIKDYLKKGDLLVLNNTKVLPARLYGFKEKTKGKVEILLLESKKDRYWEVLVRPGKIVHTDTKIIFGPELEGIVEGKNEEKGSYFIQFNFKGNFKEILNKIGKMPIPPYIKEELKTGNDYQTVYAAQDGSIAAPTAGLHFTKSLLGDLTHKGIEIVYLTLHVGRGTFEPIRTSKVEEHKMDSEFYSVSSNVAQKIDQARSEKRRVISVGTTTTRTLESAFDFNQGRIVSGSNWSDIFIFPGYKFKVVDVLITNFHLPQSTPLMLVAAFTGKNFLLKAYQEAIRERYRFYSFGDAMIIV
ncbi:tRNA preQ1(34) S-adenosylmethionine ribosyltransferase-isomerase QueA [Candidatus Atribacteria bacterium RBG_19FT_COMBO_35_14]|uniref:S-adenosylmethionine:tRNA ribosyltransferase-isomerase n=1 Tax=Candidatus Sediminicultor quintus TaxID=1797291 RepID=A0A1F5A7T6_9BACT|nr:MAG: tRNA preQ1(34) S-adenosylmethionine ribosyltransferase-isomerase QueA [Candidatus Atribacteria bacterium RBG_19FT_COMBO_35_14]OGD36050.1 MAG: tRNA preQ1(34) S-adenosylmethionine ribosyltransferase-isomerase QueA [Candidatus Atribacteria bacterium RBG_16_35_8]